MSGGEEKIEECVLVLVGSHSPDFDMSYIVWLQWTPSAPKADVSLLSVT